MFYSVLSYDGEDSFFVSFFTNVIIDPDKDILLA